MANKKDFATAFVANSPGTGGTSLVLDSGYGQTMPSVPFYLTLTPPGQLTTLGNSEKVLVTARPGTADTFTITRAQGDTTAKNVAAGWIAVNAIYTDDVVTSNSTIAKETPAGSVNGSNATFTTANPYVAGSLQVYIDGIAQFSYITETNPATGSFTLDQAPSTGSNVRVSYLYSPSASGNADTVDGIHANTTATANQILPLDGNARYPASVLPLGAVVQIVETDYNAVVTGSGVIPHDDTIPQITEGLELMTQTITPTAVGNILLVEVEIMLAVSINSQRIAALFQDSTANALAAKSTYVGNWTDPVVLTLRKKVTATSTSATTFRVRGGCEAAGNVTMNGALGNRKFGDTTKSSIKITEYKA